MNLFTIVAAGIFAVLDVRAKEKPLNARVSVSATMKPATHKAFQYQDQLFKVYVLPS